MSSKEQSERSEESTPVEQELKKTKKGMRGRLSRLLPSGHSQTKLSSRDPSPETEAPKGDSPVTKASSSSASEQVEGGRGETRVR